MSRSIFCLLLIAFCLGGRAYGQTTYATITGVIKDQSGSAVPAVTVTATNQATNVTVTTVSNSEGIYTLPQLIEGSYTIRALTRLRSARPPPPEALPLRSANRRSPTRLQSRS
ncbi:MAG: carboxypeptidase-like regulatory domain-containing protein [Acidobacteria bacterium]|nr:carboxypeptidase-like regulatory domain-containing protein [Acidobacteriota bacterium]